MIPTASASWAQLQAEQFVAVNSLDPNLTDHIATAMQYGYSAGLAGAVSRDSGYAAVGLIP